MVAAMALFGVLPHRPKPPGPEAMAWVMVPAMLVGIPAAIVIFALYYAAASYAALQADLGIKVSVREAFAKAWSRAGRSVLLMVLRSLYVALPILLSWGVVIGGVMLLNSSSRGNISPTAAFFLLPLGLLLYFGSLVYAILMGLRLSLAFPACVQEGLTARTALKRSGQLTQGAKGRIFLVLLVIYAISYALVLILYAVGMTLIAISALVAVAGHMHPAPPWSYIGLSLIGICGFGVLFLWIAVVWAGYSTAFAILYRDQRLRKDRLLPALPQAGELV
jgi:hypothetical protein